MKHVDTLLGIVEQDKAQDRSQEQARAEAATTLQALQSLKEQPGWALFMERMRSDRTHALIQLAKAGNDQLAKVAGILLQTESCIAWLDDTAAELVQVIKSE